MGAEGKDFSVFFLERFAKENGAGSLLRRSA